MDVEPLHELGPVGLGGLDAQVELAGDLLRGMPLGNELENLPLGRGQPIERRGRLAGARRT